MPRGCGKAVFDSPPSKIMKNLSHYSCSVSVFLQLLEFDKELSVFKDRLHELEISFPPSYPYSEDSSQGKQYMNTRCPAWCDRILMSSSARDLVLKVSMTLPLLVQLRGLCQISSYFHILTCNSPPPPPIPPPQL
ncbi:hypothetical protein INR49_012401 [Caranx melampygus]|nr:hypothetical protein INR49_012401 [Caranx melampygus]